MHDPQAVGLLVVPATQAAMNRAMTSGPSERAYASRAAINGHFRAAINGLLRTETEGEGEGSCLPMEVEMEIQAITKVVKEP